MLQRRSRVSPGFKLCVQQNCKGQSSLQKSDLYLGPRPEGRCVSAVSQSSRPFSGVPKTSNDHNLDVRYWASHHT